MRVAGSLRSQTEKARLCWFCCCLTRKKRERTTTRDHDEKKKEREAWYLLILTSSPPPLSRSARRLCLEGVLSALEGRKTLGGAEGLGGKLLGGEGSALGAGESGAEIKGLVLLSGKELADGLSLLLGDDSLHGGDTMTELLAAKPRARQKKKKGGRVRREEENVEGTDRDRAGGGGDVERGRGGRQTSW